MQDVLAHLLVLDEVRAVLEPEDVGIDRVHCDREIEPVDVNCGLFFR